MQSIEDIWSDVLQIVQKNMSKPSYDTWKLVPSEHPSIVQPT
ncbi:hypothetical protein, partial [Listeria fleischmannii]